MRWEKNQEIEDKLSNLEAEMKKKLDKATADAERYENEKNDKEQQLQTMTILRDQRAEEEIFFQEKYK